MIVTDTQPDYLDSKLEMFPNNFVLILCKANNGNSL